MRVAILAILLSSAAFAGTNNLPVEHAGTIQLQHVNKFQQAFSGDLVPRDTSGNVGTNTASLGTSVYKWLKEFVASGGWSLGDIKVHHSYNGAAPIGEGWMLCDGRQITSANYDTEHGAGHWTTYVASSPLLNLYLPNMTTRYPVGVASTTQTGVGAITAVGNAGNTVNLTHTHVIGSHTHGVTFGSVNFTPGAPSGSYYSPGGNFTTNGNSDAGTNSAAGGSTAQNIQPDSIEVQYYMRVVQ